MNKKILYINLAFFFLSLIIYLFTRLWQIDKFPVYFFTDEANIVLLGEKVVDNRFKGEDNILFPMYFYADGNRWTPVFPAYIHGLTSRIFGKSIVVARSTSSIVSILTPLGIAIILYVLKIKHWWIGSLLAVVTSSFFLHSRTVFETSVATSFYAAFLMFYLLYRNKSRWFIFPAALFFAFTFYSYSNAQLIAVATLLMLVISDIKFHLKNWKINILAVIFGLILASPFYNFQRLHNRGIVNHLCTVESLWCSSVSLNSKISRLFNNYRKAIDIRYWFYPHTSELERHRMQNYSHLPVFLLPFFFLGLIVCLLKIKNSSYRVILIALLVTPLGGTLAAVSITRILMFIIPVLIIGSIGINLLISILGRLIPNYFLHFAIFVFLTSNAMNMTQNALQNGGVWYRSYGLYGLQFGAKEIFTQYLPEYLKKDNTVIGISSNWANAPEKFIPFFIPKNKQTRVRIQNLADFLQNIRNVDNLLLVLPASEYQQAKNSPILKSVIADKIIPYPDGTPGFYISRIEYSDTAETIIARDKEMKKKPVEESIEIGQEQYDITYSRLSDGKLAYLFDNNYRTLIRGLQANPFILNINFRREKTLKGIRMNLGLANFSITATLKDKDNRVIYTFNNAYQNLATDPYSQAEIIFPKTYTASYLVMEIKDTQLNDFAQIHIRDLYFL